MERMLNLGCGQFPKPGYVNLDVDPNSKADVRHDLNQFPYPFEDESFSRIEAAHVLEHLPDPFVVMKEIHRIAEPGAIVDIRVPHFSRGMTHAEHKSGFDITFPLYFQEDWEGGYTGCEFELLEMRLTWSAYPHLKRKVLGSFSHLASKLLGGVIDFLANLSPALCSRLWCFWVGGFEEIHFVFRKKT
jgi:SAM-dependent methyltransferase